jgi:hypothetical protein
LLADAGDIAEGTHGLPLRVPVAEASTPEVGGAAREMIADLVRQIVVQPARVQCVSESGNPGHSLLFVELRVTEHAGNAG